MKAIEMAQRNLLHVIKSVDYFPDLKLTQEHNTGLDIIVERIQRIQERGNAT